MQGQKINFRFYERISIDADGNVRNGVSNRPVWIGLTQKHAIFAEMPLQLHDIELFDFAQTFFNFNGELFRLKSFARFLVEIQRVAAFRLVICRENVFV